MFKIPLVLFLWLVCVAAAAFVAGFMIHFGWSAL